MFQGMKVSITIPVYNEEHFIGDLLSDIPEIIDYIVVVDDASTDNSWEIIKSFQDSRIYRIRHEENQGVGKSTLAGHNKGVELNADFLVRIDGDYQMDLDYLVPLLEPLMENNIHFTKGNRLRIKEMRGEMPRFRLFGNLILSLLIRFMTGYHNISDPQNGYTAIKKDVYMRLNRKRIKTCFVYENSILFELSELGANIKEIDMHSKYREETSSIIYSKFIWSMLSYMIVCILRRFRRGIRKFIHRKQKQEISL